MLEVAIHHHDGLRKKWQIIEVNKENVIPLLHLPWAWVMKLASHTQRSIQVWGIVSQSLLLHSYNLSTILAYATRSPSPSKFNNSFEAVLPPRNPPAEDQFCLCSHLILSHVGFHQEGCRRTSQEEHQIFQCIWQIIGQTLVQNIQNIFTTMMLDLGKENTY